MHVLLAKSEIGTITNTLFSGPYAGWYKGEIEAYDSVFKTYKIKYQDNDIGNETAKHTASCRRYKDGEVVSWRAVGAYMFRETSGP